MLLALLATADGVSPRFQYEEAYDNVADGDWYRDSDNSDAYLAWGESYVLMSLAAMFRATGDPIYLERLDHHLNGVLASRDDVRGVTDYRGVSDACWQNTAYQPGEQPYCYVVHTGMIIYPMAEFARLVDDAGLATWTASDGETFGGKAARWTQAAEEGVAAHDDQWRADGTYVFRSDASFLTYAGVDIPFNQSNAMGRALLSLYDVTGDAAYLDKATGLASRFRGDILFSDDAAYWNYWGGTYSGNGEDISHAAINADFVAMAAQRGVVFSDADAEAVAETFVGTVAVSDTEFTDFMGGSATNGSSYRPQIGRWLALTPWRPGVYTLIYDAFRDDYPGSSSGATSLLAWGLLSEHELPRCAHFFYSVDWDDQGDWREATAYSANVLTKLPSDACMVPLQVERNSTTAVQQWDGSAYHHLVTWGPDATERTRHIPYDTRWPYVYWEGGVLFQFADDPITSFGIRVREPVEWAAPTVLSTAPTVGELEVPLVYAPEASGDEPLWWSLADGPTDARVDFATGELSWKPTDAGTHEFVLQVENDVGLAEQAFSVLVEGDAPDSPVDSPVDSESPDNESGGHDSESGGGEEPSCGCMAPAPSGAALALLALLALVRRSRP
ncbi:MAG: hypothetical protein GY913_16055 [Proteobacteria bacterium]|nr:hypothetical protein [Pseudomonadota bacterium]MCP4918419.1 hypothetical protein [Pseudomonadota bacterium]